MTESFLDELLAAAEHYRTAASWPPPRYDVIHFGETIATDLDETEAVNVIIAKAKEDIATARARRRWRFWRRRGFVPAFAVPRPRDLPPDVA